MMRKEVFDGFNVPLRSAISIHPGNLNKENANTSRKALSIDSRVKVSMQNKILVESKTYTKLLP